MATHSNYETKMLFFDIHAIVSVTKIDFTKNLKVIVGVNQFLFSNISYFDI